MCLSSRTKGSVQKAVFQIYSFLWEAHGYLAFYIKRHYTEIIETCKVRCDSIKGDECGEDYAWNCYRVAWADGGMELLIRLVPVGRVANVGDYVWHHCLSFLDAVGSRRCVELLHEK